MRPPSWYRLPMSVRLRGRRSTQVTWWQGTGTTRHPPTTSASTTVWRCERGEDRGLTVSASITRYPCAVVCPAHHTRTRRFSPVSSAPNSSASWPTSMLQTEWENGIHWTLYTVVMKSKEKKKNENWYSACLDSEFSLISRIWKYFSCIRL